MSSVAARPRRPSPSISNTVLYCTVLVRERWRIASGTREKDLTCALLVRERRTTKREVARAYFWCAQTKWAIIIYFFLRGCKIVVNLVRFICFYREFVLFPSGRDTFYFPTKFPRDFIFLTCWDRESLKQKINGDTSDDRFFAFSSFFGYFTVKKRYQKKKNSVV